MKRPARTVMTDLLIAILVLVSVVAAPGGRGSSSAASLAPDPVLEWNTIAVRVVRASGAFQPEGFVLLAYVQAAVYDAVVKITGGYAPYHDFTIGSDVVAQADPEAAVAAAAYHALLHYVPSQQSAIQVAYDTYVAAHPNAAQAAGVLLGMSSASDIVGLRMNDGFRAPSDPTLGHGALQPGVWQLASPTASAQTPWLGAMRPFLIDRPAQFRSDPPPALSTVEYAEGLNETKEYGAKYSTVRTPDQTATAYFWNGNVIDQYHRALRDVATGHGFDLPQTARALVMADMVGSDAFIGCFESKYHYLFWRPFTAIPHADIDGNDATVADPTWVPLLPTPGHPEYPSAHGCITGAIAKVLSALLGTAKVNVTLWGGENGSMALTTSRIFEKTSDIEKDVTDARVWIGFHYRGSVVAGLVLGRQTAHWTLSRFFLATN